MGLDFKLDLEYTSTLNESTGELSMNHEGTSKQIEDAAEFLMEVKSIERSAKEDRILAEEALAMLVGVRPEGATTFNSGGWMVAIKRARRIRHAGAMHNHPPGQAVH